MADELKRVGLVFKQDGAVDFKKTLQEVNIELNKNYNQFKLTQAQWDSSTKSTEKLRAEQEYLKNAYEIQSDKVSTLRMQLSDLENAEEKNTTAIKKKRNELTAAEIKLESYNKRIKEIESQLHNTGKKIEEFGEKVEKVGGKIENAGKKMSAFSAASATALITSAKTAIDFEDAFAGVEKTVDGTAEQMEELKQGIRDMAKEIPSTTTEISSVAEAAGQLGIKTEDVLDFTKVMIDLGNSTNLSAEEAASSLAKFANVTNMSAKDYDRLGSTIVALGNNFATTEADIVAMAQNLASTGKQVGMSESDIMALATALSSVGLEAQAGGTAFSKALTKIQLAVETNSKDLKNWADVAGMSTKEFADLFEKDATKALEAFIRGLSECGGETESAIKVLDDMGITETRMRDALLRSANASETFTKAIKLGSDAWEDNTALTKEANKRYDTLKSKITVAINKLKDMAITIGNKLMPHIEKIIDKFGKWVEKFNNLSDKQVDMIVKIGLIVAAIGPLVTILGKVTSATGKTIEGIGTFVQAIQVASGKITSTSTAVNNLASVFSAVTSPVGLACTAIAAITAAVIYFTTKETEAEKANREFAEQMSNSKKELEEYNNSIDKTTNANLSHINSVDRLKNELVELVDENGKVKSGYESRVKFILNELNEALGTEYELNGNLIKGYKDLQGEIDNLIKKKRAEIVLSSYEEKYNNAINSQESAVEDLEKAYQELLKTEEEYGMNLDELRAKAQEYYNNADSWITGKGFAGKMWKKNADDIQNVINAYDDAEYRVKTYTKEAENYERYYALFVEGNYSAIYNTVKNTTQDWTNESLDTIKSSIQETAKNLDTYKKLYETTGSNVILTQKEQAEESLKNLADELEKRTSTVDTLGENEIKAWKQLADSSYSTYYDKISNLPPELSKKIQEMTGVTATRTPELVNETEKMMDSVLEEISKNEDFKKEASNNMTSFLNGLSDEELRTLLKDAGIKDVEQVIKGIKEGNLAEDEGEKILKSLKDGLDNQAWKNSLWSTARNIASTLSGLLTVKANVNGKTSTLPGHKLGLDYVPKDNYVARLHKGERVLTAEENKAYSKAEEKSTRTSSTSFINNSQEVNYNKMADAFLNALNKCKLTLDEDGFARLVKNELYEVI